MSYSRNTSIIYRGYLFGIIIISFLFTIHSRADEIRALWITRWDYHSPEEVCTIIDNATSSGFNLLLFQCRGNATVFYHSDIEPWAWELTSSNPATTGKDPGWDPLQTAIEYAHKKGIELHAYMNVYPGWRGTIPPPPDVPQLYNTHPDWLSVKSNGTTVTLNSGYMPLSPGIPAVQDYLFNVYMEVVDRYAVDGIHLDYIRYFGSNYSWDTVSLRRFAEATGGGTPETKPAEWSQWRRDQVTALVRRIYYGAHSRRPDITVSAATWPYYTSGRDTYFQDAYAWMSEGILDVSFKMTYFTSVNTLRQHSTDAIEHRGIRQVVPAVGVHRFSSNVALALEQTNLIRSLGADGVVFFAYSSLYPGHTPTQTAQSLRDGPFRFGDVRPLMLWISNPTDDDPLGPRIFNPACEPEFPAAGEPFYILCNITDESGVYDDDTGPNGNGVRLRWAIDANPRSYGTTITLSRTSGDTFRTDSPLTTPDIGKTLYYQILAFDNDTNAGDTDRALRISPIFSIQVGLAQIYHFVEQGGQVSGSPQYAAVDAQGRIWVCEWANNQVRVFERDGMPASFSPITQGLSASGNPRQLLYPSGICAAPDGTVWVSLDNDYDSPKFSSLAHFVASSGQALPGVELPFRPGDCDSDAAGEFFVAHKVEDAWTVWAAAPAESVTSATLTGPAFPGDHINRAVSCTWDGNRVYQGSGADGAVWLWERTSPDSLIFTRRTEPFAPADARAGAVDVASNGWIFVSEGSQNAVKLYAPDGALLQTLKSGSPEVEPRGVAITPDTSRLYVVPFSGEPYLQIWERSISSSGWLAR